MEFASEPYLYADDTKIFKEIYKTRDCEDLQKDMHLCMPGQKNGC